MPEPPPPGLGYRVAQLGALGTAAGGVFDFLLPRLLPHHHAFLGVAPAETPAQTATLILLLLHVLGLALVAVGAGALALLAAWRRTGLTFAAVAAACIVPLAEGMNAYAIYRVGSAFFIGPLAFAVLTPAGVALELSRSRRRVAAAG